MGVSLPKRAAICDPLHHFAGICHSLPMTVQADGGYVYPVWSFSDRIRKARVDVAGMNQEAFAAALGVSEGSLASWETNRAKPRDIVAVAKRIEMLTHIPAAWLLGIEDAPDRGPGGGSQAVGANRRQIELMQ